MTFRLVVAGFLVAASHLIVLGIHTGMEPKPAELPTVTAATLPESVGDFDGRDEPLDKRLVAGSEADIMINRVYRNRVGDFIMANVGVWTRYGTVIPHRPEICYTRAGWEIASRRELKVPLKSGKIASIMQYVFQRGTSRIAVAFWVHLGDANFSDSEGVRKVRQRFRMSGGNLPPLIKVMLQTDAQDIGQANARLSRFIVNLMPYTESIH